MILQNLVIPDGDCPSPELYIHQERMMDGRTLLDLCTYFNMFPIARWKEFTGIVSFDLNVEVIGTVCLELVAICVEGFTSVIFRDEVVGEVSVHIPDTGARMLGIRITLEEGGCFKEGSFSTSSEPVRVPKMVIDMCTFHRESDAVSKMGSFIDSLGRFGHPYCDNVGMVVVDNASTLPVERNHPGLIIVRNANSGGSGGFARGLYEARNSFPDITHVLFMDDDIVLDFEVVYRVFALSCYLRPEYSGHMIAGTMIRRETPTWTFGPGIMSSDGRPVGDGTDVSTIQGCVGMDSITEPDSGGWWFFCSPYVSDSDYPFPLFIGYDDVIYSHVHGRSIISMPGIGVWHPSLDRRYDPSRLFYYDVRNNLISMSLQGVRTKGQIGEYFHRGVMEVLCMRPRNALLMSRALRDYTHGPDSLLHPESTNRDIRAMAYVVRQGKSMDIDCNEPKVNRKLWTAMTLNGQLLPKKGCGKASKTSICAASCYRVRSMLHADEGSGWFITHSDVILSIRTLLSLLSSSVSAYIFSSRAEMGFREASDELSSEALWKTMFEDTR